MGCFSFNGNKIITTGGGGMIVTDDESYARTARYLTTQAKDDPLYFVHNEIGYNFRLTNVQAAIGVAQLEQLPRFKEIKQGNYTAYAEAMADIPGLELADVPPYANNNCWMCAVQIDSTRYGMDRDQLLRHCRQHGVEVRPLWHLNHLQRPYRGYDTYCIDRAQRLLDVTVNIPCSVGLTEEQRTAVIQVLRR
jgi:dTDP-4-amino-4,6-dideoxygalactose transaminase